MNLLGSFGSSHPWSSSVSWQQTEFSGIHCLFFFLCLNASSYYPISRFCVVGFSRHPWAEEKLKHFPVFSGSICTYRILQNIVQFTNSSSLNPAPTPKSHWWKITFFGGEEIPSIVIVKSMSDPWDVFLCVSTCPMRMLPSASIKPSARYPGLVWAYELCTV